MEFKLVTLGDGRVGKTSLVLKFVKDCFEDAQESTINANFLTKSITVEGRTAAFHIWDTAGQEKYRALARLYYRNAAGALVVYDVTDSNSFDRVVAWVKELRAMASADIAIVIAGNKADLDRERQVDKARAVAYAKEVGAVHFSTSAKTGKGVGDAFDELARRVFASQPVVTPRTVGKRLEVVPRGTSQPEKRCC